MACGTVTSHSWNDGVEDDEAEPKMGTRVNSKLQYDPGLYSVQPRRDRFARHRFDDEDD